MLLKIVIQSVCRQEPKLIVPELVNIYFDSSDKNEHPANVYLFKVNNKNTRKMCEICSKLTIKTAERRH